MQAFDLLDLQEEHGRSGSAYLEFLRVSSMSAGLYVLPTGGDDPQQPHAEDEIYVVMRGKGRFLVGEEDRAVAAGTVLFVATGAVHRFHQITEDLHLIVVFAPAEDAVSSTAPVTTREVTR